jgi:hypothetical protein
VSEFPTQVGADSADKMVVEVGNADKPAAAERSARTRATGISSSFYPNGERHE